MLRLPTSLSASPARCIAIIAILLASAHPARALAQPAAAAQEGDAGSAASPLLLVGLAETDITPPVGFPMAGYYHERLAEGAIDPLKAKAVVFRQGETAAALVVCDLIGIATDLSREVRRRAADRTGIPAGHIVIAATHSHTAPDYMRELYLYLAGDPQEELRAKYIELLISGPVDAIAAAAEQARPATPTAAHASAAHARLVQSPLRDARRQRPDLAKPQ